MEISIENKNGELCVVAPYNLKFVSSAKKLSGRWKKPAWVFDVRDEKRVRDLCVDVYGTDGNSFADLVAVRVFYGANDLEERGPITLFGRTVAYASGRDSGAKLGEGIVLLSGRFKSGGSVKNWTTEATENTSILMRDVPRAAVEQMIAKGITWIEIENESETVDRSALKLEREKIIKRLDQINVLLSGGV